jgi:uncharacterized protein (DUF1778 family)
MGGGFYVIKNITIKMTEDEHYRIKLAATISKKTLQEFVLQAIARELELLELKEREGV